MTGCMDSAQQNIFVDDCAGSDGLIVTSTIEIFPNPANDILNIEVLYAETVHLLLVNLLGQVVYSQKIEKGVDRKLIEMDVSRYPSGIYSIHLEGGKVHMVQKVMIE